MSATSVAHTRKVAITIVSDVICPWCFVGVRRLDKAIAAAKTALPHVEVSFRWLPFYLDPSLPPEGVDKLDRYTAKFGASRVASMLPQMQRTGAAEGIAFSFKGKTASTRQAHRLVEWARRAGGDAPANRLMLELFGDYFERERNPGDAGVLAAAAERAGVAPAAAAAAFLADAAAAPTGADVDREVAAVARRYRVTGVPFFVVDDKFGVAGAQDPDALLDVIRKAAEDDDE